MISWLQAVENVSRDLTDIFDSVWLFHFIFIPFLKTTDMKPTTFISDYGEIPSITLTDDLIIKLEPDDLTPEYREVAQKELRENPDRAKTAIEELRALIKEDGEMIVPMDHDQFMVRFLRPCKYYPESAFNLMKQYYMFKVKHKNSFQGLVPAKEKNLFDNDIVTVLANRDQLGRRVLILELGKRWNPKKVTLEEVFKGCVLYIEAALTEQATQICGAVVIFDMNGLSMQQVLQFTPPFAKKIVDLLQDALPLRLKNIHIVNQPYIFNMVFALFKPFLKDKLRSRIIFHGSDRDSLHNYLSPKCLPACYGGTNETPRITGPMWFEMLSKAGEEFEAINKYGMKSLVNGTDAKS